MDIRAIERVCVVGSGFMGAQIGLQCAVYGRAVAMHDVSEPAFERCRREQADVLDDQIQAGVAAGAGARQALNLALQVVQLETPFLGKVAQDTMDRPFWVLKKG